MNILSEMYRQSGQGLEGRGNGAKYEKRMGGGGELQGRCEGRLQLYQLNHGRYRYQLGLPSRLKGHAWKQEDRGEPCSTGSHSDKKSTRAITQAGEGGGLCRGARLIEQKRTEEG